ncbi:MAG: sn-glycerol-3-phosphate ABC transporter ATP-binding protein UgpC [Desulfobacterales bacterium]|jgi:multiple sugar transport system ATP-binding protein
MAEVRLTDIIKRYGQNVAVDQLNLTIQDKEFLVLVGPSGCGKTTTLRIVAGLEQQSDGDVFIGEERVNDVPPKDRDIAMVFQNYALYPHMDVYKNMAFGLMQRKMAKPEIEQRVTDAAKILGIQNLMERKPRELSGGQRQRVAMGRAIVRKPQVFLFDEPLSNLDAKLRVQMRGELAKLHDQLETTIIYVTHDQIEAMTLADRIVIMEKGIVMQMGKPMEVYENPLNLFVAGFIGSPAMNLIDADLVEDNGRIWVDTGSFRLPVPPTHIGKYRPYLNREVVFGVRPEHIYDRALAGEVVAAAHIEAVVDVFEPVGSEVILLVSAGDRQMTAKVDPRTSAQAHHPIELCVDMGRMHLFDKTTGKVIDET